MHHGEVLDKGQNGRWADDQLGKAIVPKVGSEQLGVEPWFNKTTVVGGEV